MRASDLLRAARRLLAVGVILCLGGCGPGNLAPVSGRVTWDGQPLANIHVGFSPFGTADNENPGQGSYGTTDAEGKYHLIQIGTNRVGAVVGKHHVRLRAPTQANANNPDGRALPGKFVMPKEYDKESKLEFEVQAGITNAADFEISSKGQGAARPSR
jgi:hypothetical protein